MPKLRSHIALAWAWAALITLPRDAHASLESLARLERQSLKLKAAAHLAAASKKPLPPGNVQSLGPGSSHPHPKYHASGHHTAHNHTHDNHLRYHTKLRNHTKSSTSTKTNRTKAWSSNPWVRFTCPDPCEPGKSLRMQMSDGVLVTGVIPEGAKAGQVVPIRVDRNAGVKLKTALTRDGSTDVGMEFKQKNRTRLHRGGVPHHHFHQHADHRAKPPPPP